MRVVRPLAAVVLTVAVMAVLAFGVFPTRTFLAQRAATERAQQKLEVLNAQTRALEERAAQLDTDAEIERLAREQYGMVKPGEEAYVVLPPPLPELDLPEFWLFGDPDRDPAAGLGEEPGVPAPTQTPRG